MYIRTRVHAVYRKIYRLFGYKHAFLHTRTQAHVHIYVCTHICTFTHTQLALAKEGCMHVLSWRVCMFVHTCPRMGRHARVHVYTCVCVYVYVCEELLKHVSFIYRFAHTCANTCTYINTQICTKNPKYDAQTTYTPSHCTHIHMHAGGASTAKRRAAHRLGATKGGPAARPGGNTGPRDSGNGVQRFGAATAACNRG